MFPNVSPPSPNSARRSEPDPETSSAKCPADAEKAGSEKNEGASEAPSTKSTRTDCDVAGSSTAGSGLSPRAGAAQASRLRAMTESSSSQARQMPQTPHTPQGAGCNLFSLTIDTNTKIVRGGDGKLIDLAKLEKVASPELYFHGSRSASLLLFSNLGDNTYHQLLPMGEMIDKGVAYYSGEGGAYGVGNSVMPNAFNKKYVSVTNAQNFGSAYNHVINDSPAWHPDGFKQSREATDKLKLHDAQIITDFHQLQQRRNAQWDEMNDKQKSLVLSNFPVIYAIDTGEVELAYTDSSVNGEKGFPGGIPPDQISMLFVPDKNVDDTVEFFQQTELFRQMKVKGFSSFYKDP